MRLDQEEESQNIEDRRGVRVSRGVVGGGIGTLALILVALFFVVDPSLLLQGTLEETNVRQSPAPEQRVRWFRQGLERGDLGLCNTFERDALS